MWMPDTVVFAGLTAPSGCFPIAMDYLSYTHFPSDLIISRLGSPKASDDLIAVCKEPSVVPSSKQIVVNDAEPQKFESKGNS